MTQMSLFSFQKPPTAFKSVEVPKQLSQEFLDIAEENSLKNIEICGIIGGKDAGKKFTVTLLFIPKQQGTSDSCIAVDEDLTDNALQQNSCIVLGWIHTHPTKTSFQSSIVKHRLAYTFWISESITRSICCCVFRKICQQKVFTSYKI